MKYKWSEYNEKDGFSFVTVEHMGKEFTGKAALHPDDVDHASVYTGCRYAHERAEIKALKYEHKIKKAACDEAIKFLKAVACYKDFDGKTATAKAMYKQINKRVSEVNKLADKITEKEFNLKASIRHQEKIIQRNRAKEENNVE